MMGPELGASDADLAESRAWKFSLRQLFIAVSTVSILLACYLYLGGGGVMLGLLVSGGIYGVRRRPWQLVCFVAVLLCLFGPWGYGKIRQGVARAQLARVGVRLVTDDDFGLLFSDVERLESPGDRLLDNDLSWLQLAPTVEVVLLNGTRISDAGLVHLQGLPRVRWLDLSGTSITDAGLVNLGGIGNLEWLVLDDTRITDQGLRHVSRLGDLDHLSLEGTAVTDSGLAHLRDLKNLRQLDLAGTKVSEEAIRGLQDACPSVVVYK